MGFWSAKKKKKRFLGGEVRAITLQLGQEIGEKKED